MFQQPTLARPQAYDNISWVILRTSQADEKINNDMFNVVRHKNQLQKFKICHLLTRMSFQTWNLSSVFLSLLYNRSQFVCCLFVCLVPETFFKIYIYIYFFFFFFVVVVLSVGGNSLGQRVNIYFCSPQKKIRHMGLERHKVNDHRIVGFSPLLGFLQLPHKHKVTVTSFKEPGSWTVKRRTLKQLEQKSL